MTYKLPTGFFAYPSQPPSLPETIRNAVEQINQSKQVYVRTWEDFRIGGKAIIQEICKAIAEADVVLADLTGLNPNVLFEVGYAIAKGKRIWPILDTSLGGTDFTELRTLSTIGYSGYASSNDISKAYFRERPHEQLNETLLEKLIKPSLQPGVSSSILYLKSQHETDASVQLTKRLATAGKRVVVDDPREAPAQTLAWYGQYAYSAEAVVCHLTNPTRQGAKLRNARYALVAGLAYGLGKNVLILSEGDYLAPLDYRDMLKHYQTAAAAARHLESWLLPLEESWRASLESKDLHSANLRLATELKGLNLGEYIAENESDRLVDGYFIETSAYKEAVTGTHTIFVGRKGTGKSANFLQLAARLGADPRVVLSVIKPVAYELEGILRVLRDHGDRDKKVYVIESLWKFLLYSDLAASLYDKLSAKPVPALSGPESQFLDFFAANAKLLSGDFAGRLEQCIDALQKKSPANTADDSIGKFRSSVAALLHDEVLNGLRSHLLAAMPRGARAALIIDNLDKAWDRQSDFHSLAEFLLGLLSAAHKLRNELRNDFAEHASMAVFLRADIFERVQQVAREPDKIKFTRLSWTDKEMLFNLLEERFVAANSEDVSRESLWQFFCATVKGIATKEYLALATLPRPRDFIYLVKAAISVAINRGHAIVEEGDILEAQKQYSEFALGILIIEDSSQEGVLEKVVYEFAATNARVHDEDLRKRIVAAGVTAESVNAIVEQLCTLSFLGIEVEDDDYRFPDNAIELKKVTVLSKRRCETLGARPVYLVHEAFRPFLEVVA